MSWRIHCHYVWSEEKTKYFFIHFVDIQRWISLFKLIFLHFETTKMKIDFSSQLTIDRYDHDQCWCDECILITIDFSFLSWAHPWWWLTDVQLPKEDVLNGLTAWTICLTPVLFMTCVSRQTICKKEEKKITYYSIFSFASHNVLIFFLSISFSVCLCVCFLSFSYFQWNYLTCRDDFSSIVIFFFLVPPKDQDT